MSPPVPQSDQIVDNVEPPESGPRIERRNKMVILNGLPLDFARHHYRSIDAVRWLACKVTFRQNPKSNDARLEISRHGRAPTDAQLAVMVSEAEKLLELTKLAPTSAPARKIKPSTKGAFEDYLSN